MLELTAQPACWHSYGGAGAQRSILKPDSYARLGVGDFEDSYFFEIDRGTEGSRALTVKLRQYAAYYDSGQEQAERGVFPRVLWLTPTAERAEVIEGCIERLPTAARELFRVGLFTQILSIVVPAQKR